MYLKILNIYLEELADQQLLSSYKKDNKKLIVKVS